MKITFLGAAGVVTGSCTLIETDRAKILIDAGFFQGQSVLQKRNVRLPRVRLNTIDAVVLTHAHLDHCGRLPVFAKHKLDCPIYATHATCDLARLILSDAAHIQEEDARRQSRRNLRQGGRATVPLFTFKDVFRAVSMFRRIPYGKKITVADGIEAVYHDAGHILGSAMIELWVQDGATKHRLVFSGDIGYAPQPVIEDPSELSQARLVVMESTYGDRDHRNLDASVEELREVIKCAIEDGGKILIPSFAVGRAQTLLYHFREFAREGLLKNVPVFLDSPMAIEATDIYSRHEELYDKETRAVLEQEGNPFVFPNLEILNSASESREINKLDGPAIVIAGAGMCNGGRILHHFLHHAWQENTHIIFSGFQVEGTLGRRIIDGAKTIKIMGNPVRIRAKIHTIGGFSAHADQTHLVKWIQNFEPSNPHVILNHGEDRAREPLAALIKEKTGLKVSLASESEPIEI